MTDCIKHPEWVFSMTSFSCPQCAANSTPAVSTKTTNRTYKGKSSVGRMDVTNGTAAAAQRKRIRERDNYSCRMCKIGVQVGEVDHVRALVNGGNNHDNNLQLLCSVCHKEKTAIDLGHKVRTGVTADGMPTSKSHHWNI
jgi:5-methylcytosine-specific restriction protein A